MRFSLSDYKAAVKSLDGFIDWQELLGKSRKNTIKSGRPSLKNFNPTESQKRKIKKAFHAMAGHKAERRDFQRIRKSVKRNKAQQFTGTESYFTGYFSNAKITGFGEDFATFSKSYKEGREIITYRYKMFRFPTIPTTEEEVRAMVRDLIAAHKREIKSSKFVGLASNDAAFSKMSSSDKVLAGDLENEAAYIWAKYETAFNIGKETGFTDPASLRHNGRKAAHPSDWFFGLAAFK